MPPSLQFWSHSGVFLWSACGGLPWHFLIPVRATSLIPTAPQLCSGTRRSVVSGCGQGNMVKPRVVTVRSLLRQGSGFVVKLIRGQYNPLRTWPKQKSWQSSQSSYISIHNRYWKWIFLERNCIQSQAAWNLKQLFSFCDIYITVWKYRKSHQVFPWLLSILSSSKVNK